MDFDVIFSSLPKYGHGALVTFALLVMSLAFGLAAALPLALALGPGAELRAPMAIAVIGGVFVSTLLTLFVVPCVYELLSGFESSRVAEATREKEIAQATKETG